MFKVGIGYDTHILVAGRKLFLGGIDIPYEKGLQGHSDADVLLHAICDALLGASGHGDIGEQFPDTDSKFKDISSRTLLREVMDLIGKTYRVVNIDAVILCQSPKLSPYKSDMQTLIRELTGADQVVVKATTTEGMNAEGAGDCISTQAICLLQLRDPS